jgi:transposase
MDESHFQQQTGRCVAWTPPEVKDPVYLQEPGRKSVKVFGALEKNGTLHTMFTNVINGDTVKQFLEFLTEKVTGHFYLILDNNKPHRCDKIRDWLDIKKDRVTPFFLPPYAPHLNKIEKVWKVSKKKITHNKYFPTIDLLRQSLDNQFKTWQQPNETLRTLYGN